MKLTTAKAPTPKSGPLPVETRKHTAALALRRLFPYAFLAPFMVAFVMMLIVPIVYAFYLSLQKERLIGGSAFVGLDNYLQALADPELFAGLGRTGLLLVVQVPIMLAIALFFALVLDAAVVRGMRFVRLAIFLPYAIPGVVGVLIWGYLYGVNYGLITQAFEALGLAAPNLLTEQTMLGSIMNIVTWQYVGYNMIIMFAALRAVPSELTESAVIDGAGPWRIAWSIKIPAITSAILLTITFSSIGAFQVFTEPNLLQPLSPAVITQSYTPSFYAFNTAFSNGDSGYAAAISFVLAFVIAVVSYFVQLSIHRRAR